MLRADRVDQTFPRREEAATIDVALRERECARIDAVTVGGRSVTLRSLPYESGDSAGLSFDSAGDNDLGDSQGGATLFA